METLEEVGADKIFIFGHTSPEVAALKAEGYDPQAFISRGLLA